MTGQRWVMLGAAAVALLAQGCESACEIHRSAQCFDAPAEAIESFRVVTTTGDDSSDADIFFCVELKSRSGEVCREMATAGDDFQSNRTDVFDVAIAVDPGDLDEVFIKNQGNAVFGNNEWEIVGLTVEARTATSMLSIYDEPGITCGNIVDTGQRYQPMNCAW
jgi:hypothetical protein